MSMKLRPIAVWRTRASPGPGLPTRTSSQARTSGPPALWKRMAWVMTRPFLFQILLEEVRSPLVREVSGFLVVVLAADAGEGVIHAGIAVNGDVRVALERVLDLGLRRRRTELVLLGDVEHQRLLDRFGLVERALDADSVVADGSVCVGTRRHQIGELAAEAVADRADLARAGRELPQMRERRREVIDALRLVEALVKRERLLPLGIGLIGDLDAGLLAPEQVGAEHDIALPREAVGQIAHHLVDAENLLDQHHAGAARGGCCQIGAEAAAIGGANGDVGHGAAPVVICAKLSPGSARLSPRAP